MTVYGGFDPGTFQPWALNIHQSSLGQAGIARGLVVTPNNPAAMTVLVTLDPNALDGVCWLPNGCWLRIDAQVTLSVPNNTSGNVRVDAIVAQVDPTGTPAANVSYTTNWATGFNAAQTNQLVLALVNVPNGASGIVSSNIVQNPLGASVGTAPVTVLDAPGADPGVANTTPEIFTQWNVTLSTNPTNGQTSWTIPLTGFQRLVPMGKIGGADETGYFASAQGWYIPQVVGSVSGNLGVIAVNAVTGILTTALGAQSGETVTFSGKVYDFARDLHVWGGEQLLERNSPYIVYQGDLLPGTTHLTNELYYGTQNGYLLAENTVIQVTFFGQYVIPHLKNFSGTVQTAIDGSVTSTRGSGAKADLLFEYGWTNAVGGGSDGIHLFSLTLISGQTEFAGVSVSTKVVGTLYVDGGEATVNGRRVLVQNSSIAVTPALATADQLLVYVNQYGNITTSLNTAVVGDQHGGRVPLAQALQYGGVFNTFGQVTSATYGVYALPQNVNAIPTWVTLSNSSVALSKAGQGNGWMLTPDPGSPYGGYVTSTTTNDRLSVFACCSGMDGLLLANTTTQVSVTVDNHSTTVYWVVNSGNPRVRLTFFTGTELNTHTVTATVLSSGSNLSFEALDLRVPREVPPPANSLPLAQVFVYGQQQAFQHNLLHDMVYNGPQPGQFQLLVDGAHGGQGPLVYMPNLTTGVQIIGAASFSGASEVVYLSGQSSGIVGVFAQGVSTSIDTYMNTSTWQLVTSSSITQAQGADTIQLFTTNSKNASSQSNGLYIVGFEGNPAMWVRDVRRFANDGQRPSARGSSLLSYKGSSLPEAGYGLHTAHLNDRSVTSRKLAPTYVVTTANNSVVVVQTYDQQTATTITVEVPSALLICYNAPIHIPASGLAWGYIDVDGSPASGQSASNLALWETSNAAASDKQYGVAIATIAEVGPGSHLVRFYQGGTGTIWFNSDSTRTMSIVAFAL